MQTFLPYPDFERCAAVLDPKRLGKQRVDVFADVPPDLPYVWPGTTGPIASPPPAARRTAQ